MAKKQFEVIVIGGGVAGASTAYHLAKLGKKVALLEKSGGLGHRASGSNMGYLWVHTRKPGPQLRLALASEEMYRTLTEELGSDFMYSRTGGMILGQNEDEAQILREFVELRQQDGLPMRFVDAKEIREIEPNLPDHFLGASFNPLDGMVNPIFLTIAFADAAKRLGAEVITNAEVTGVEATGGRVTGVRSAAGDFGADAVVNSAGSYSVEINRALGLECPITPGRISVTVTAPAPPSLRHPIISPNSIQNYVLFKRCPSHAAYMEKVAKESPIKKIGEWTELPMLLINQMPGGQILVGEYQDSSPSYNIGVREAHISAIARQVLTVMPSYDKLPVIRSWTGLAPFTPDDVPMVGPAPGLEGFYMGTGFNAHGVLISPAAGRVIAETVAGVETFIRSDDMQYSRFVKQPVTTGASQDF